MQCCDSLIPIEEKCPEECECNWPSLVANVNPPGTNVICGEVISSFTIPSGTPITVTFNHNCIPPPPTCSPGCGWSVNGPGGFTAAGACANCSPCNFAFTPPTTGSYTATLNANCDGTQCPPCRIMFRWIEIGQCSCRWTDVEVEWPRIMGPPFTETHSVTCGATPAVGDAPVGSDVTVSFAASCSPTPCQVLNYNWTLTPPSGTGSTGTCTTTPCSFSFTPTSEGSYDVSLVATCNDGTTCRCNFKIYAKELTTEPEPESFIRKIINFFKGRPAKEKSDLGGDEIRKAMELTKNSETREELEKILEKLDRVEYFQKKKDQANAIKWKEEALKELNEIIEKAKSKGETDRFVEELQKTREKLGKELEKEKAVEEEPVKAKAKPVGRKTAEQPPSPP